MNTIYFKNPSAYFLYVFELEGQISDGYWENSSPYNHWEWLNDTEPTIDKNKTGYTGIMHSRRYGVEWLKKDVRKAFKGEEDYDWAMRAFKYAKLGSILSNEEAIEVVNKFGFGDIAEILPIQEIDNAGLEKAYKDEIKKRFPNTDTFEKRWGSAGSIFSDEFLKKYYSSNYSMRDFYSDLDSAYISMNTNI